MNKQVKSRQRVADHGEVFTAEREVKAMCDLVLPETQRIDSRFLEPACGDGNFLAEVLSRKLAVVRKKYRRSTIDYEMNSLLAVSSLYGVDILADNVAACRERLYKLWAKQYKSVCKSECSDDMHRSIRFILERNIVCGNALTLCCVDENCNDTDEPMSIALGMNACEAGYRVKFYTAVNLAAELAEAVQMNRLSKLEKSLSKIDLLIIDELSYLTFNRYQSEMLFQIISERSERASVIITTNLEFSEWTQLFENEMMLAALIDRVTFRSFVLNMNCNSSYRIDSTMNND